LLRRECDTALSAGGALRDFPPDDPGAVDLDATWSIELRPDGSGTLGIGASPTVLPPMPSGSSDLLTCLRPLFDHTRHLGRISSPSAVLPMVLTQFRVASVMAKQRAGTQRRQLLLHSAHTAEFAGWMVQECGNNAAALEWTDLAVRLASDAGDRHMTSYAVVRAAMVSLYSGDSTTTTALAEQVLSDDAVHPRIRWLAAVGAAQGYALAVDHTHSMRALDVAAGLHEAVRRAGDDHPLGPSTLHERPTLIDAWCRYDLGDFAMAASLFDQAISENPEQSPRARARFGTRHAMAYAALDAPDHACALIEPLLDDIRSVDSATIRMDLGKFDSMMRRYRGLSALDGIRPALDSALAGK
jgi:tetratricopeptide (TPR) repeat protein